VSKSENRPMDHNDALWKAAEAALKHAYAPYSGVHVGVALRTASGAIFAGCNVENASSAGVCAEQSAVSAAVAGGERKIVEVAIVSNQPKALPPCGRCRQTLWEFGSPQTLVTWKTPRGESQSATLGELLPYAFGQEHLTKV
jgi:cytidine deaminase